MNMRHALPWGSKRRRASYWIAVVKDGDGSALITVTADLTVKRHNMISGDEYPLPYTLLARDSIMERLDVAGELHSAAISPDGRFVLGSLSDVHSGDVRIWDVGSGALIGRLHGHSQRAESFAFVADGSMLATGGFDHTAHSWDLTPLYTKTSRQPSEEVPEGPEDYQLSMDPKVTFREHRGSVDAIAISQDGRWVVSVSLNHDDHDVRLWDPLVGKTELIVSGHVGGGDQSGGIIASGDWEGMARVWQFEDESGS
ncbi:hypothetical protein FRC00_011453 [Tulasnella sp. 408]|nr:hypothetical protein FRC00_011453 [Tulasnella sp. 408]